VDFQDHIRRNKRATIRLFVVVFLIVAALVTVLGYVFLGNILISAVLAIVIGLVYLAISSAFSVAAVLKSARARPANPAVREEKLLVYKVEELALAAGLPVPKVYVQEDDDINAFATGRNPKEAIVCVTTTALRELNQEELEGVLAHELSHIKNYDIRVSLYAIALIGLIAILGEITFRAMFFSGGRRDSKVPPVFIIVALVFAILAPILSRLVYLAISRRREFLADATGASLSRNPEGLARALEKIAGRQPTAHHGDRTVASLYLDNPFRKRGHRGSAFSTHPPLEERIARLRNRRQG
jgi:heat shock protein HtpX